MAPAVKSAFNTKTLVDAARPKEPLPAKSGSIIWWRMHVIPDKACLPIPSPGTMARNFLLTVNLRTDLAWLSLQTASSIPDGPRIRQIGTQRSWKASAQGLAFQGALTLFRLGSLMQKMNIDLDAIKNGERPSITC